MLTTSTWLSFWGFVYAVLCFSGCLDPDSFVFFVYTEPQQIEDVICGYKKDGN